MSYADISSQAQNIAAIIDNDTPIATADIPTSGSSRYSGVILFVDQAETGVLFGQTNIDVSFGTNTATGQVGDFVYAEQVTDEDADLPTVRGQLTLDDGIIDRTAGSGDAQIVGELNGTLTPSTEMFGINSGTTTSIATSFEAVLLEDSLLGLADGSATGGSTSVDIAGILVAEEN
ncbi:hypothetical protein TW80_16785 [Loktanella sp. S4079]|nr:hypothetical protein TW80_16785 [Loktanella sp. S4079]